MRFQSLTRTLSGVAVAGLLALTPGPAGAGALVDLDFSRTRDGLLKTLSLPLFGVLRPLEAPAPETDGQYRLADQPASAQVRLAPGLRAHYLTRNAGDATDMMVLFPTQGPTHLVTCVEGDREVIGTLPDGSDKYNPSVQRVRLRDGSVETILRGMSACDGIRATDWGTVLVTEERSDGGAYEILDPLAITDATLLDRATGANTAPDQIAKRTGLPTMAWEGIAVLPSGVVIGGDELRPGTGGADRDGGAIFKFVPASPRDPASGPIGSLAESPLTAGAVWALQVSCQAGTQQYGQGCEVGNAAWISVSAASARSDANTRGATGYYRPEDLHQDPLFEAPDSDPSAIRFCWTNTQIEEGGSFGEVMCAVDVEPLVASAVQRTVLVSRFLEGGERWNSFDNLEFQPHSGNVYVIEDHPNGEVIACLGDGADQDLQADGCIATLSVADSSAEPTGFFFAPDGRTAYVSIQHSDDEGIADFDDYPTDDVLVISGFAVRPR
jgi:hypothetical protein